MITIDGATGYGQVLRTSIALSALTLKPVRVVNIRKQRIKPGLMPQHLTGVKVAGEFCHAKIKGLKIGSVEVEFKPHYHDIKDKTIDIGTAGSITLLLQTLTPLLIFGNKPVNLTMRGGTDVKGAPTSIYFQHIFSDYMKRMGCEIFVETLQHGFYPKGGGMVKVRFSPVKKLNSLNLTERGDLVRADVCSIASKDLQKPKVAERQIKGFEENFKLPIANRNLMYVDSLSTGTSFYAHVHYENCKLGASKIGERGRRAEEVGREVAVELKNSVQSNACLDKWMSDQIIPFIVLADGKSRITVEEMTEHVKTNISVIEKILGVKFSVDGNRIEVDGIGFTGL